METLFIIFSALTRDLGILVISCIIRLETRTWFVFSIKVFGESLCILLNVCHNIPIEVYYVFYIHPRT